MNIEGIGIDVVNVERILYTLEHQRDRFKEKVFTEEEWEYAKKRSCGDSELMAASLAARWAGKEAVAKALGSGFGKGLYWRNIEIVSGHGGPPYVRLVDPPEALKHKRFLLSLSHDYPTATAMALLLE